MTADSGLISVVTEVCVGATHVQDETHSRPQHGAAMQIKFEVVVPFELAIQNAKRS